MEFETQEEQLRQIEKEWKETGKIGENDTLKLKGNKQILEWINKDGIKVETEVFAFVEPKIITKEGSKIVNNFPRDYTNAEQPIATYRQTKSGLIYNHHYPMGGIDIEYIPAIYEKSGDLSGVSKQCFIRYMGDMMGDKIIPKPISLGRLVKTANMLGYANKPKRKISKDEILDVLDYLSKNHVRGDYWIGIYDLVYRSLYPLLYTIKYEKKRQVMCNKPIKNPSDSPQERNKLILYAKNKKNKYIPLRYNSRTSKILNDLFKVNSDKIKYYDDIICTMRNYWK